MSLGNGVRTKLADVPDLPAAAVEGLASAMESSAGQALTGLRDEPGSEAIVPLIDAAFEEAARLTGFSAFLFVLLGLGFSVLLPETRLAEQRTLEASEPDVPAAT